MDTILVAGASGQLGRHIVRELKRHGHRVRALTRAPERHAHLADADEVVRGDLADPPSLAGICQGVDAVFSCAGASLRLDAPADRRSFTSVDHEGNLALLAEARAASVQRFGYVAVFGGDRLPRSEYARAHERFVHALRASEIPATIIRPTGFFSFLGELVGMARRGRVPVLGDGAARSNPIHEADLAAVCVAAFRAGEPEVAVGGPQVLTRRQMAELAFQALGRPPRLVHVPVWAFRGVTALARPVNPRIHSLLSFGIAASTTDLVAPAYGTRDLLGYFRELAR